MNPNEGEIHTLSIQQTGSIGENLPTIMEPKRSSVPGIEAVLGERPVMRHHEGSESGVDHTSGTLTPDGGTLEEGLSGSISHKGSARATMTRFTTSDDPEQGASIPLPKASWTNDKKHHIRPMTTVIDINPKDEITTPARYTAMDFQSQQQHVNDGSVRLILKQVPDLWDFKSFRDPRSSRSMKPLFGALHTSKKSFWADMKSGHWIKMIEKMMKADMYAESAHSLGISYRVRQLHELVSSTSKANRHERFVVRSNLKEEGFPKGMKQPTEKDEFTMISTPEKIYNGSFSLSTTFWRMLIETEIDWLDHNASVGEQHKSTGILEGIRPLTFDSNLLSSLSPRSRQRGSARTGEFLTFTIQF
jgi:hypothetical protein